MTIESAAQALEKHFREKGENIRFIVTKSHRHTMAFLAASRLLMMQLWMVKNGVKKTVAVVQEEVIVNSEFNPSYYSSLEVKMLGCMFNIIEHPEVLEDD